MTGRRPPRWAAAPARTTSEMPANRVGDNPWFAGDVPHGYAAAGSSGPARFALTVFQPPVGRSGR